MSADQPRRKLRRRLVMWSLPFALVAAAFGFLFVAQHIVAERAVAQHLNEQHEQALNSSGQLTLINLVERWKPHYNMGTSYLELDALPEARTQLEKALGLATPLEQCPIRANLAITIEREGDLLVTEGDSAGGIAKYEEALEIIGGQDAACDSSTSNRSLDDSEIRIQEKLQQQQPPSDPSEDSDDSEDQQPENAPNPDALEDLEDGLSENRDDREEQVEEDENGGGGGGYGVDEPW